MKKYFIILLICITSLVACNIREELVEEEKVVLKFAWWGGEQRNESTLAMIEKYESLNPNVKIEVEYSGYDRYYQKITTQLIGGTAPDIFQIDQPWIYELTSEGSFLADLRTVDNIVNIEAFDSRFIKEFCQVDGEIIGLPTGINGMTMLFHKENIEKADINYKNQWDWDDLVEFGNMFRQAHGEDAYLMNVSMDSFRVFILQPYVNQLSGNSFITDNKELGFTEEELIEGFSYIVKLIDNKVVQLPKRTGISQNNDEISEENEKIGGSFSWVSSLINSLEEGEDEYVTIGFPIRSNTSNTSIIVRPSQLLALNESSDKIEEAAKFLEFFMNSKESVETLGVVRGIPASEHAIEILEESGQLPKLITDAIKLSQKHQGVKSSISNDLQEIQTSIQEVVELVIFKELTPEEATKELMTRLEAILTK